MVKTFTYDRLFDLREIALKCKKSQVVYAFVKKSSSVSMFSMTGNYIRVAVVNWETESGVVDEEV